MNKILYISKGFGYKIKTGVIKKTIENFSQN
jgi:hypothetical protein